MENKQSSRKTRGRSKSSSVDASGPAAEEEMAPNLNGNKDGGNENDVPTEIKQENTVKTRKRKAAEMKAEEGSPEEAPKRVPDPVKEVIKDVQKEVVADAPKEVAKDAPKEVSKDTPIEATVELPMDVEPKADDESSANDSASELKDISITEKQLLGKGKRARVPNKRYSDIVPSKSIDGHKAKLTENGQFTDDSEIIKEESESEVSLTKKGGVGSPGGSMLKKQKASSIDLSNPNFLKPFQFGWKRELVYRTNTENSTSFKRQGDIYYYTPSGKKVRSMREVAENLKDKELSIDDFTFSKEPIGVDDPEKEIIRDAKYKVATGVVPKKATPKVVKTTKIGSPKLVTSTPVVGDSLKTKSPRSTGSFKVKPPKGGSNKKDKKPIKQESELDMGTYSPNWTTPAKKGKSFTEAATKPCQPCSIRCEGVSGLIPTLQCRLCLCLYHNECVGFPAGSNILGYVCKNCQLEQDPKTGAAPLTSPPPPLTPVNTLKPVQISVLPKLQRIPKVNDVTQTTSEVTAVLPELPKLTPKPGITVPPVTQTTSHTEPKSILGSVTTWFPQSSTIQVGNNESSNSEMAPQDPPRPQLVEFVGNKKYLIVPRHNILSVAPLASNIVKSPEKLSVDNVNGDDESKVCDIKVEPESPPKFADQPFDPLETDPLVMNNSTINPVTGASEHADFCEEAASQQITSEQEKSELVTRSRPLRGKPAAETEGKTDSSKFMDTYLQNLAYGYNTLLYVFQYLKVQDLLRAGCVCTMWRDIARHPILWNTVRMKNSQIHSFEGLANALRQHGTVHLDLRKMLLPTNGGDDIWPSFTNAIKKVESLRKIELCRCLASVVEELASNNHRLEAINAVTIKCESMTFEPFKNLKHLTDLRLKSTAGLTLTSDLSALKELTNLKHLSITSIKDLNKLNIEVIGELVNLEVLDIGECADFPKHFGPDILCKLVKLEKLRLEKGQGECYTFEILDAVKDLYSLHQLELVNFDIKAGFDKALGACLNIKKLLIIPTYISQSATTNHMVLGGVLKLQKTLSHFVWGVTLELLRVTELFVDQCEQPDKKDMSKDKNINNGDSIPVLKPVPLHGIAQPETSLPTDTPQVEILPLPNLQKLLLQNLPTTRVKILKIPFHATWRQSITDSVN